MQHHGTAPNAYRLTLKGVPIGDGESFPGQYLAINPGRVSGQLAGTPTQDPAFGLPTVWIDATLREQAHVLGYTVVDASTVIATTEQQARAIFYNMCNTAREHLDLRLDYLGNARVPTADHLAGALQSRLSPTSAGGDWLGFLLPRHRRSTEGRFCVEPT